jgi:hypothetical protein
VSDRLVSLLPLSDRSALIADGLRAAQQATFRDQLVQDSFWHPARSGSWLERQVRYHQRGDESRELPIKPKSA